MQSRPGTCGALQPPQTLGRGCLRPQPGSASNASLPALGRVLRCWLRVGSAGVRLNLVQFPLQPPLRVPQIVVLLQPQPKLRPIAGKLPYSQGHFRRNRVRTCQHAVELLARNAKPSGRFTNRQPNRRQHVVAKDLAWMHRLTLQGTLYLIFSHTHLSDTAPNQPEPPHRHSIRT